MPHSLLWRNHDAYLALGFFYGGERVVRLLQFGVGVAVFGAALALCRRLRFEGSAALVVLALAAFPLAMLQLRATYVDWPAALLVTAAAAELAAGRAGGGRLRLAGFLFGGAVATKVFALGALPALLILSVRARPRPSPKQVAGALACALAALGPWLAWSARHAGSIAAPYAASPAELVERVASGHYFQTSPASGVAAPPRAPGARLRALATLPYDLVFHSSRFESNGDGYNGILVLVLLVGLAGWDARRVALFCVAAVPWLVPWSLLYLPSIRYLFPVYPLYAVFCAEGLRRLTRASCGRVGRGGGGRPARRGGRLSGAARIERRGVEGGRGTDVARAEPRGPPSGLPPLAGRHGPGSRALRRRERPVSLPGRARLERRIPARWPPGAAIRRRGGRGSTRSA